MRLIRFALLWILLVPALPTYADDAAMLWLGIVRADHAIVPFAFFDGSGWSNHWPGGEDDVPKITLTLDTIPKEWYAPLSRMPREWHVQSIEGASATVKVTRPVTVFSHCVTYWGLLIGNADIPGDTDSVVPLNGFAVSPNVQTDPTTAIGEDSTEWKRILAFIRPVFEKAEVDRSHPLSPTEREKAEFVISRLDRGRTGPDGRTIFHFEAERDYAKTNQLPARSDHARSCMTGWIAADRTGGLSLIEQDFKFEIPEGDTRIPRIIPLGTATIGGKTLWVVQNQYYEGESYSVLEIGQSGVRLLIDTYGGGC